MRNGLKMRVRKSLPEDPEYLSEKLRSEDCLELKLAGNLDTLSALKRSLVNAKFAFTLLSLDNQVQAMAGVGWTNNPRVGLVWLLSSDYIYSVSREFLRLCRPGIASFMQGHDVLYNNVHDANVKSLNWLNWLGFEATRTYQTGDSGAPFTEMSLFASDEIREIYMRRRWPFELDAQGVLIGLEGSRGSS